MGFVGHMRGHCRRPAVEYWMNIQLPDSCAPSSKAAKDFNGGCQVRGKPSPGAAATRRPMQTTAPKLSMTQVLACGAMIVTLSMGIRHGFGLWLQPITQAQGWTRETFAFALAIQNLSWGVFGIFAGMMADRFGAFRVLGRRGALCAGPGRHGAVAQRLSVHADGRAC
jgi:hypothetical protein